MEEGGGGGEIVLLKHAQMGPFLELSKLVFYFPIVSFTHTLLGFFFPYSAVLQRLLQPEARF